MITHSDSVHLRYTLLLNAIAALVPMLGLKGRANDPLLYSSWWPFHDQHSAVILVSAAAVLGTVLIYLLILRNVRRWWSFVLCGAFTGAFPCLFYLVAATVPNQLFVGVVATLIAGVVWGSIIGVVIYAVVGKAAGRPNPNQRLERP